jgi:hypothetical protein
VIEPLLTEFQRSGQRIMLPWTSMYELTKGNGDNFVASVRHLSERPEAVSVAYATIRLYQERERRFLRLAVDVTHPDSTRNLRVILSGLADGSISEREAREIMKPVAAAAHNLVSALDFESKVRSVTRGLAEDLDGSSANAIRSALVKKDREPLRRALVERLSHNQLHRHLSEVSVPFAKARKLARMPSFAALNLVGWTTIALRWSVLRGIENTRKPLENDVIDLENALVALYGRNFISKDQNAKDLYEDLRAVVPLVWP